MQKTCKYVHTPSLDTKLALSPRPSVGTPQTRGLGPAQSLFVKSTYRLTVQDVGQRGSGFGVFTLRRGSKESRMSWGSTVWSLHSLRGAGGAGPGGKGDTRGEGESKTG